jgi:hypothetical protein
MLFHVTTQHSQETCRGRLRAEGAPNTPTNAEAQRWIEGNDDVKVLAVGGYQSSHRYYAFVEAEDYNSVVLLFNPEMWVGDVEVLPVNDMIARRNDAGEWGK